MEEGEKEEREEEEEEEEEGGEVTEKREVGEHMERREEGHEGRRWNTAAMKKRMMVLPQQRNAWGEREEVRLPIITPIMRTIPRMMMMKDMKGEAGGVEEAEMMAAVEEEEETKEGRAMVEEEEEEEERIPHRPLLMGMTAERVAERIVNAALPPLQ